MEAAGIAQAAHLAGRQYLVVRSFVDYCDSNKSDTWHWHAAACAAAVSTTIISSLELANI
jgi:nucleoside phosphorylase